MPNENQNTDNIDSIDSNNESESNSDQKAHLSLLCFKSESEPGELKKFIINDNNNNSDIKEQFNSIMNEALDASNLIVLSGLGTSMCLDKNAPTMQSLFTSIVEKVTENYFEKIANILKYKSESNDQQKINVNIEHFLSQCKMYIDLFSDSDSEEDKKCAKHVSTFVEQAEKVIYDQIKGFVRIDTDLKYHEKFITNISSRAINKSRAKIFTTNYDLCFEYAARKKGFTIIDGFSHSLEQTYNPSYFEYDIVRRETGKESPSFIPNVFHLYKLHGSIDWFKNDKKIVRSLDQSNNTPLIIYPRNSKYREAFDTPYFDMMAAFQFALREPNTAIIICGFGFNDDHISNPIWSAIENNLKLKVIICDPMISEKVKSESTILEKIHKLAQAGDHRIHLINGTFQDFVQLMPNRDAQTERERHVERINKTKMRATTNDANSEKI